MTARAVPEWIGKNADAKVPARVRLRVFEAHNGTCHLTGRKIHAGDKWDLDHIQALCNGGEHRESNLAPALCEPHRAKTTEDVKQRAKDDRVRKKHLGIWKPKSRLGGGKFKKKVDGTVVPRNAAEDDDILGDLF